jgi:hypothetical protein
MPALCGNDGVLRDAVFRGRPDESACPKRMTPPDY